MVEGSGIEAELFRRLFLCGCSSHIRKDLSPVSLSRQWLWLCLALQDGLGASHLGRVEVEVNFPFCPSSVCAKETALAGFELVQSAKLSVKADCGLRFCLTQLFIHCWLSQFNLELNWFKRPHKPPALVYLCLLGRGDVQQQLRESWPSCEFSK